MEELRKTITGQIIQKQMEVSSRKDMLTRYVTH